MDKACAVIAEIGVNHDGSIDKAHALIDHAKDAGVDAVKFQCFSADRLATRDASLADYQKRSTTYSSQHEMLRGLELTREEFVELERHCRGVSVEFMATAFDEDWLEFLVDLGVKRLKWPSGE